MKETSIQQLLYEVRALTEGMSRTELVELLLGLARQLPVEARGGFLGNLHCLTGDADATTQSKEEDVDGDERLLRIIEQIREEAEECQEKIENGEWDELEEVERRGRGYGWHDYYYDDEPPDVLTSEHKGQLREILKIADHCYLDGEYRRVAKLYHALIEFEGMAWDDLDSVADVCEQSVAEKYCRCVLSLAGQQERGTVLYGALGVVAANLRFRCGAYGECGMLPLDGISLSPDDLAQLQEVVGRNNSQLAMRLYIELLVMGNQWDRAQHWLEEFGEKHSSALFYFLDVLEQVEDWSRLSECCRFALEFLQENDRLHAASLLVKAGAALKKETDIVDGLRISFFWSPSVERIVELAGRIQSSENLSTELGKYDRFLARSSFNQCHAVVLLLQGRFDELLERCASNPKPLGWSYSAPDAIAFSAGLLRLCSNKDDLPPQVQNLMSRHFFPNSIFTTVQTKESGERTVWNRRFMVLMHDAISQPPLEKDEKRHLLTGLRKMVSRRTEKIVESKYRKAYGRVAEGLTAWAEVAGLNGSPKDSDDLIQEFLKKFPRHSAFKRELSQRC